MVAQWTSWNLWRCFLRVYKSKEELKTEINKTFEKYISEFDSIPESLKDKRVDEVDRTPAENLAYQVGWTTLVLKWEEDERRGLQVKTPSDEFKWNQLGELYQGFTDTYVHVLLGKHADTGNVVRNQTAHAGDSAVLTSMYSAMRRS